MARTAAPARSSTETPLPWNDLALEMMRQHTLLMVMTARMRETSDRLEHGAPVVRDRLERGLGVHRRFLIDLHQANEAALAKALAKVADAEVKARLRDCALEHPKAAAFEEKARELVARDGPEASRALGALFRAEADRLDEHHGREDEMYRGLDRFLPAAARARLLAAFRKFEAGHIAAEIDLIAWSAQIHPSSD